MQANLDDSSDRALVMGYIEDLSGSGEGAQA